MLKEPCNYFGSTNELVIRGLAPHILKLKLGGNGQ
jgi:hypothetical protein